MQNVVITGGTSGFGKAIAHGFCKRNANVLIAGRNRQTLAETKAKIQLATHGNCFIQQCDVTNKVDLTNLADYAQDLFKGNIHHWINNAGVCEGPEDFDNLSLDDIEDVINTNIIAVMLGTKMASNIRVKNIYAVSGHGSDCAKTPTFSVYGASKAAISQFYSSIIAEANQQDIKTSSYHVIAPGLMKTPLTKKLLSNKQLNAFAKTIIETIAMEPEDVAEKIVPKILSIAAQTDANINGRIIRPLF